MSDTGQGCWLPPPLAFFPFTSPPVRFRVPPDSVSTLTLDRLFRVKLKTAGYPLHAPLSPSLLLPRVVVCHQIPFPLYYSNTAREMSQKELGQRRRSPGPRPATGCALCCVAGEVMNQFVRTNWEVVFKEMKPLVDEAITTIFTDAARKVFDRFTFAELFPVG